MRELSLLFCCVYFCSSLYGQESFKELSQSTLDFSYNAQSKEELKQALDKWENLKRLCPDSIMDVHRWEIVSVANQVEQDTLCFNMLFELLQNTVDDDGIPTFAEVLARCPGGFRFFDEQALMQ
ncbi:hypothetical protein ACYSNX_04275 [Myroides sp. LJL115]